MTPERVSSGRRNACIPSHSLTYPGKQEERSGGERLPRLSETGVTLVWRKVQGEAPPAPSVNHKLESLVWWVERGHGVMLSLLSSQVPGAKQKEQHILPACFLYLSPCYKKRQEGFAVLLSPSPRLGWEGRGTAATVSSLLHKLGTPQFGKEAGEGFLALSGSSWWACHPAGQWGWDCKTKNPGIGFGEAVPMPGSQFSALNVASTAQPGRGRDCNAQGDQKSGSRKLSSSLVPRPWALNSSLPTQLSSGGGDWGTQGLRTGTGKPPPFWFMTLKSLNVCSSAAWYMWQFKIQGAGTQAQESCPWNHPICSLLGLNLRQFKLWWGGGGSCLLTNFPLPRKGRG